VLSSVAIIVLIFSPSTFAQSVNQRDISADSVLLKNGNMGGVLPSTGSQALPGGFLPATGQPLAGSDGRVAAQVNLKGVSGSGLKDHKANIYDVSGSVKIRKKGDRQWLVAEPGMLIQKDFEILTGKNSHVSITFDTRFANVTHITANTKAHIRSIEPTDIFIEDGRIYNVLDGLPKGSQWKVSTPVAVSAVRGTWYVVGYTMADGTFVTATFDVPDDGQTSNVEVIGIVEGAAQGASANVPEGNQISLSEGQAPDPSLVGTIDPKWLSQILDFLARLGEYRAQNNGQLPPTGSSFFSAGPGSVGGSDPELDPLLDTGAGLGNAFSPSPPSPPDEDPGGPEDCPRFPCA